MHASTIGSRSSLTLALLALAVARAQSTGEWTQVNPATSPPPLAGDMVYDVVRDRVVLTAGTDVWEFDGIDWQRFQPPTSGGPSRLWWDDQLGRVLRIQDAQSPPAPASLLGWNGATWDLLASVPAAPQPLGAGSWTFDATRRLGVWYLGDNNRSDTYEWNGLAYVQRAASGPTPRTGQSMAFDRWRNETVLFGGLVGAAVGNDTWIWNGSAWSEQRGVPSPPARCSATIAFDSHRNRVLLFGGSLGGPAALNDTWEWDGWAWVAAYALTSPPPLAAAAMVFDSNRNRFVLFGGIDGNGNPGNQTWTWSSVSNMPSTFTAYGQGCGGAAGAPLLSAMPGSVPGIGQLFQMALTNLPPSSLNVLFGIAGLDNQSWNGAPLPLSLNSFGMPGCSLWVRPDVSVLLGSAGASTSWSILIPCFPALVGMDVYVQTAVVAPGANAAGFLLSNAGHIAVGTP